MNFEHETASDFFDEIGDQYDQAIYRCVPRYVEMLDQMLDYVEIVHPENILELGGGTGNLTSRLHDRFPNASINVVDASVEMIRMLQRRFGDHENLKPIEKSFEHLEFPPNSFDLIASSISIHHLDDSQKLDLFERARLWLKPNGVFTFCDQFSGETESLYSRHMTHWKQASMKMGATDEEWNDWMLHQEAHDFHSSLSTHFDLLRRAGFKTVDCTRRYFLWTTMIAFGC